MLEPVIILLLLKRGAGPLQGELVIGCAICKIGNDSVGFALQH